MDTINVQLIEKFLNGTASKEEGRQIEDWLASEEADHSILAQYMESQWDGKAAVINSHTDQRLLSKLQQKLYPGLVAPQTVHQLRPKQNWWRLVAACLIPLAIISTVFIVRNEQPGNTVAQQQIPWIQLYNATQQTHLYLLPDSSSVWLSSNSQLAYPANFATAPRRETRLSGEAFFDVTHSKERPFVIHTGSLLTTVLGTAFNIEAYETEKQVRISLVRGKVAVQKQDGTTKSAPHLLYAGEMLSWQKNTSNMYKERLPISAMSNWTKGYMIFNDVPLADVLQRIAQRYHLQVRYAAGVLPVASSITTVLRGDALNEFTHILPFVSPYKCSIKKEVLYVTDK